MTETKPDEEDINRQRTVLLAGDLKNSILAEIDAGDLNRITYSPYGHQSAQHGVITQLGFNGELREVKPEWYLLGNGYRAFNPRLMRFTSSDSLSPFREGGLNAYGYCAGEPVMNSDPTGHSIWAFSRFVQSLTGKVGDVAIQVMSKTVNTVGSGVSQVLGAARNVAKGAKNVFADNFLFDPHVMKKLGPPPPKTQPKPPANFVYTPNRYNNPYSSLSRSRQQSTLGRTPPTSHQGNDLPRNVRRASPNTGNMSNPVASIREPN